MESTCRAPMPRRKIVLGVHWEQNSGASLFIDGCLVGAASEERFSGVKNDERYPVSAIEELLKVHHVDPSDITTVAVASLMWSAEYTLLRFYSRSNVKRHVDEQKRYWYPKFYEGKRLDRLQVFNDDIDFDQYPGISFWRNALHRIIRERAEVNCSSQYELELRSAVIKEHLGEVTIVSIEHTSAHAAVGALFYPVLPDRTIVLSLDGWGDGANYSARLIRKSKNKYRVSLICRGDQSIIARLYRYVTLILGMKPNEHEYKVMGLAPYSSKSYYGEAESIFSEYQKVLDSSFIQGQKKQVDLYFEIKARLEGIRFDNIAGGLQAFTEKTTLEWVLNLCEKYKPNKVILTGGVAMNVKSNLILAKELSTKGISFGVPLAPDDTSQCIGAGYAFLSGIHNTQTFDQECDFYPASEAPTAYLCPDESLTDDQIIGEANDRNLEVVKYTPSGAAEMIAAGAVLGRWARGAEFGARALGNRSILADPRKMESIDLINSLIKSRDFWMPFACSIIQEHVEDLLITDCQLESYKYMTLCSRTTEKGAKALRAGIHQKDHTCRPQIVFLNDNKPYYDLIKAFGDITGVYALLNTSLNTHGKPIVNHLSDAIGLISVTKLYGIIVQEDWIIYNAKILLV